MTKREKIHHFNVVINAAKQLCCEDLHHKKSDYHKPGEVCMAEYRLNRSIYLVEQMVKELVESSESDPRKGD